MSLCRSGINYTHELHIRMKGAAVGSAHVENSRRSLCMAHGIDLTPQIFFCRVPSDPIVRDLTVSRVGLRERRPEHPPHALLNPASRSLQYKFTPSLFGLIFQFFALLSLRSDRCTSGGRPLGSRRSVSHFSGIPVSSPHTKHIQPYPSFSIAACQMAEQS